MIKSYMGRQKVYCDSLENNDFKSFKIHLVKNVFRNVDNYSNSPDLLNDYCKKICFLFHTKKEDYFLLNKFEFPNL